MQKSGGPNNGTYLFAFGDDVTARNINRGLTALAENTDVLDDLLRTARAFPRRLSSTIGSPGNVLVAGSGTYIFLGTAGMTLNQANLRDYLRVVDSNGDEIMDASSLARVEVVSIVSWPTAPDPPWSDGTNLSFTLSHTLAAGTYYIVCGARSSMAIASASELYTQYLRQDFHVSAALQAVLSAMYGHPTLRPWVDYTPTSNIFLASRGIQGVLDAATSYLNVESTADWGWPTQFALDTYGVGGLWTRLDFGMVGISNWSLTDKKWRGDGLQAIYGAYFADNGIGDGSAYNAIAGGRGFVAVGTYRSSTNNGGLSSGAIAPSAALFGAYASFNDEFSDDTKAATKLDLPTAVAVFDGGGIDCVHLTTSGNWFFKTISSVSQSAIVFERTLLEIEWTDTSAPGGAAAHRETFVAVSRYDDNILVVRRLGGDGSTQSFGTSTAGTLTRVMTPLMEVLDGAQELREVYGFDSPIAQGRARGAVNILNTPDSSTSSSDKVAKYAALYLGAHEDTSVSIALAWGGYHRNVATPAYGGKYRELATLTGDGGISATWITITGLSQLLGAVTIGRPQVGVYSGTTIADTTDSVDLNVQLSQAGAVHVSGPTGAHSTITAVDITTDLTTADVGRYFDIIFKMGSSYFAQMQDASVWGSQVLFENPADAMLSGDTETIDAYHGKVILIGSTPYVLMSVRRYTY